MITRPQGARSAPAISADERTSNLYPRSVKTSSKSTLRLHERTFLNTKALVGELDVANAGGLDSFVSAGLASREFCSFETVGAAGASEVAGFLHAVRLRASAGITSARRKPFGLGVVCFVFINSVFWWGWFRMGKDARRA